MVLDQGREGGRGKASIKETDTIFVHGGGKILLNGDGLDDTG